MADLRTSYMGIELSNPIVVGACSLSKKIDTIKRLADSGAGAVVLKSLFEEQVQLEEEELRQELESYQHLYAEAQSLFPAVEHGRPKEHLYWTAEVKKAVSIPIIASLNAVNKNTWVEYSRQLADTGVDGLELNFYSVPLNPAQSSGDLEKRELEIFAAVRAAVKLPLAVKLHPYYTSVLHIARAYDELGANAIVVFNKLFQPDIDIMSEQESISRMLSNPDDNRLPLRWAALLKGQVKADIVASTGINSGADVVKMLLAGAGSVQVVSTLYKNGIGHLANINRELSKWMDGKGYEKIGDFAGKVSKQNVDDPWAFERAQYLRALLGFD